MKKDTFEELNQITETKELEEFCRGHNDAYDHKLAENPLLHMGYTEISE